VRRRDALVSVVTSGLGIAVGSWALPELANECLSEEQLGIFLRHLAGFDLPAGEGPKVLASFNSNRFKANVDPKIQPQSDFDPEVDL
jgi:hypothetical protein